MAGRFYKSALFFGLAAVLIFSPIARGAVKLWSVTPVMLVLYALIFMWLLRAVNSEKWGQSPPRGRPLSGDSPRFSGATGRKNGDSPHRGGNNGLGTVPIFPIFLFAALAVVSFAFSIYKHDSFYALLRLFAYIGLFYVVAGEFDHRARRRIIWLVIGIGGALSIYGLLQYFGIFGHSWWIPEQFLAATYVNHNHFAGYLELVIPAAAAVLTARSAERSVFPGIALVAVLVPMCAAFILTQSRGAWVSLGLSLLAMMLAMVWQGKSAARAMVVLVLAAAMAVSIAYFAGDMMSSRLATVTAAAEGEDVSGGRFKIWQGAAGMIRERPLV